MAAAEPGRRVRLPRHELRKSPSILAKVLYWLAVLLVSFAVLVGLMLFLESRDDSSLGEAGIRPAPVGAVR